MTADLVSRPYKPDPGKCCERCVFGRGEHAEWCEKGKLQVVKRFIEKGRVAQADIDKLIRKVSR